MSSSVATKRKHVIAELDDFELPTPYQIIAKVGENPGGRLFEVITPDNIKNTTKTTLASLPKKFKNNVWVKRGTFVYIEQIEEGKKVQAEIVKLLNSEHRIWLEKEGCWPEEFAESSLMKEDNVKKDKDGLVMMRGMVDENEEDGSWDSEGEETNDFYGSMGNPNTQHRRLVYNEEESSSEEESDDE